jgi:deoxyribonuclease V
VIACVDVDYREASVATACLGFAAWTDETSSYEAVAISDSPAPAYQPGEFYRRELAYLLAALRPLRGRLDAAVVDGYVWLGADRPGLGAHLHDALGIPVIGVAKSAFAGADAVEVKRGASARPLYVTAIGIDRQLAAARVRSMHGGSRIPTLLKRVDQLARGLAQPR